MEQNNKIDHNGLCANHCVSTFGLAVCSYKIDCINESPFFYIAMYW